MAINIRINSIVGIGLLTGVLVLQDYTKKNIVIKNFTQQLYNQTKSKQIIENKTTISQKIRQKTEDIGRKYNQAIETADQIKQKGSGSYYEGLRKIYEEKKMTDETPIKTYIMNEYENLKQKTAKTAQKIKDQGGIQKIVSDTVSDNYLKAKQLVKQKYQSTSDFYNKTAGLYKNASQSKTQKLVKNHLIFGGLSLVGSLLMPRSYFLLTVGYFVVYQMYYFNQNASNSTKMLSFHKFEPIWKIFIGAASLMIAGKSIKISQKYYNKAKNSSAKLYQ